MKAGVLRQGRLVVDDVPDPVVDAGQVLCAVRACGICGTDLHLIQHGDALVRAMNERPASEPSPPLTIPVLDFGRDIVLGHEFSAEVLECGPEVESIQPGDVVVSVPMLIDGAHGHGLGFSNTYPGGFAERMVMSADLAIRVPNGLDPRLAALTEPASVAEHVVNVSNITEANGALVLGAGPVGLMIVASLARRGVAPIIVSEPAAGRRALALKVGAHATVDPRTDEPIATWHATAQQAQPLVIFEAVGVPGMLDAAVTMAPPGSRLVVAGICCEPDTFLPARAFRNELNIQFAAMYSAEEFAATLRLLAEGELGVDPIATGVVGIDGLPSTCDDLMQPHDHAKVLLQPGRSGTAVAPLVLSAS